MTKSPPKKPTSCCNGDEGLCPALVQIGQSITAPVRADHEGQDGRGKPEKEIKVDLVWRRIFLTIVKNMTKSATAMRTVIKMILVTLSVIQMTNDGDSVIDMNDNDGGDNFSDMYDSD